MEHPVSEPNYENFQSNGASWQADKVGQRNFMLGGVQKLRRPKGTDRLFIEKRHLTTYRVFHI